MRYTPILTCCILVSLNMLCAAQTYTFPPSQNCFRNVDRFIVNPKDLTRLTTQTRRYFKPNSSIYKDERYNSKLYPSKKTYIERTRTALDTLDTLLTHHKTHDLLSLLEKKFVARKWNGDHYTKDTSFPPGTIRLTQYLRYRVPGRLSTCGPFRYPLYAHPTDIQTQTKFTRPEVLSGALEKPPYIHHTKPIVWLTKNGFEWAQMQGSIVVDLPNNQTKYFNMRSSNNRPYDRKRDNWHQDRYCFFVDVTDYNPRYYNIRDIPRVTFAGNIRDIGFGQIILLKYQNMITRKTEVRIGILADTGGSFDNNLTHLDFFAGTFRNYLSFKMSVVTLPRYVEAYILTPRPI